MEQWKNLQLACFQLQLLNRHRPKFVEYRCNGIVKTSSNDWIAKSADIMFNEWLLYPDPLYPQYSSTPILQHPGHLVMAKIVIINPV